MDWIETPNSSTIAKIAYDSPSSTLRVEFRNGGAYQYFDVPQQVFDDMQRAPSTGQFLAQNIKGVYRYARA